MIKKITLQNFKSYANAELKLAPLTVLIGANASGKSNALEGLRFLNLLGSGREFTAIQDDIDTNDDLVRGSTKDLPKFGESTFGFTCTLSTGTQLGISFSIEAKSPELSLVLESLSWKNEDDTTSLYSIKVPKKLSIELNFDDKKTVSGHITPDTFRPIFIQFEQVLQVFSSHLNHSEQLKTSTIEITKYLHNIQFYDPQIAKIRSYSPFNTHELKVDASNLSTSLFRYWSKSNIKEKDSLIQFISHLPELKIVDIDFVKSPRGEIMLQLIESIGGVRRKVDATLLSDGTLRILAFAVALLTAPQGSLVIIEEIDNGLHPSRAGHLLETLRNVATERGLSVLLSSHNPALLDALPDAAVPDVVFCYRNPETGNSELIRMADIDNYPDLILQGSLGDLLTEGLIDRFVKHAPKREERIKKGLEWLESVK